MALRTISDEAYLSAALDLFRAKGFEAVSLKQLADATGLEKASLYHRSPAGKSEIVMAVTGDVAAWFKENVIAPLKGTGPQKKRVSSRANTCARSMPTVPSLASPSPFHRRRFPGV